MNTDQAIERVLNDVRRRLAVGKVVSASKVLAAHPGLPGLAKLLDALLAETRSYSQVVSYSSCLSPTTQAAWARGLLGRSEITQAEAHANICCRCRMEHEEFVRFETLAGSLPAGSSPPQVPGLEVLGKLGAGGFGSVWLARDIATGNPRALKQLRVERFSAAGLAALAEEAALLDRLANHPGRIRFYKFHLAPLWILEMGFVAGRPLSELSPLDWERAVSYVTQAADALVDVHGLGLRHGDVTPSNLLLDESRDQAVLIDFGLAVRTARGGTPGFAAPEILDGQMNDDVFGLAATLFYLVSGWSPFSADGMVVSLRQAQKGMPARVPELAGVPDGVVTALRAGLEPDPQRRPKLASFRRMLAEARLSRLAQELHTLASLETGIRLRARFSLVRAGKEVHQAEASFGEGKLLRLRLRRGDVLLIEATADKDGYLAIIDFDTADREAMFYPAPGEDGQMTAEKPTRVRIEMNPAGGEHLAVVWSAEQGPVNARGWCHRIRTGRLFDLQPEAHRGGTPLPSPKPWAGLVIAVDPVVS